MDGLNGRLFYNRVHSFDVAVGPRGGKIRLVCAFDAVFRADAIEDVAFEHGFHGRTAGVFDNLVHDLRVLLRPEDRRKADPGCDHRQPHTPLGPESGACAGYNGAKRENGSKVYRVDTPGTFWRCT